MKPDTRVLGSTVASPARACRAEPSSSPPRMDSARLFAGARELEIDHHGAIYRLKQTALGKLILTK